jgi:hypothetical protein
MKSERLSKEELLKLKQEHLNMEQFIKYVNKLENALKEINKISHKSMTNKNWLDLRAINDDIMELI